MDTNRPVNELLVEPFAKIGVGRFLFGSRDFPPESFKDQVTLKPLAV